MKIDKALFMVVVALIFYPVAVQGIGFGDIDDDYNSGRITLTEKLTYKALMLTDPGSLPTRYTIDRPLKDGTLLMMDIVANWDSADRDFKDNFSFLLTRVNTQKFYDSPGGYFRIHYDTSGSHAVYQPNVDIDPEDGVPDFVNRTAEYFDLAWTYICDTLGYDTPPYDGSNGGGENLYDVYMHRYSGAYGVTFTEAPSSQRPGRNFDYTSYIYVDPTYDGFGYNDRTLPMKVTSAHEFFHAVQFAYSANAGGWFMENCSTWMEDIMWDDINDNYAYMNFFMNNVHLPLQTANGGFEYGAFIWPMFLYENWGHEFIRSTWEYCINTSAMNALETVCENNGTFLEAQYFEYSLWNYLTGFKDDGNHYEEGAAYRLARTMRTHNSYPVENQSSSLDPTALACNYILFNSGSYEGNLRLTFDGNDNELWYVQIIKATANDTHTYDVMTLDIANSGEYVVENFEQYVWVAMVADIVVGSTGDYIYSAYVEVTDVEDTPDLIPGAFALSGNYPNPFNARTVISLYSPSETSALLEIYDITGRKITAEYISLEPGENRITVDFGLIGENRLTSGTYFYRVSADGRSLSDRMLYLK